MFTHEGAKADILTIEEQLRRSVLNCLLWDNTFYENGVDIKDRITSLSKECDPKFLSYLAIEARLKYKLRSVPLLLAKELATRGGNVVSYTLEKIINRPDEITKFMSLYWENGKTSISNQVKKGLSKSFNKFNEYQLSKWNMNKDISLRDIMFLVHAKPIDEYHELLFNKLADNKLETPETWEVGLSKCTNDIEKKEIWENLLKQNKLGALALLKNIRGMQNVNVNINLIKEAFEKINVERVLPHRFVTAYRFIDKELLPYLQKAMLKCIENKQKLSGKTVLLVDVSGSMESKQSSKSDLSRLDIGIGLSILLKNLCEDIKIYSFSNDLVYVRTKNLNGFELYDKISKSQHNSGTYLGKSLYEAQLENVDCDRIIVITDEQSHDDLKRTDFRKNTYIMNIAPYKNGISFDDQDNIFRINGFSENVVDFIFEYEKPLIDLTDKLDDLFNIVWEYK